MGQDIAELVYGQRNWRAVPEPGRSLADLRPDVAGEWDYERNQPWRPEDFKFRSGVKAWWVCPKHGSYQAVIASRTNDALHGPDYLGSRCAVCRRRKPWPDECLASHYPEVAKEWHPTLNGDLTPLDVRPTSAKKVWWLCPRGHEFEAVISNRSVGGAGCRLCRPEWNWPRLQMAFGLLLPRLRRIKRPETLDRVLLESHLYYATRRGAIIVGELRAGRLPLEELAKFARGEPSLVDEIVENPVLCSRYGRPKYVSPKLRRAVFERDGHCCLRCGTTENLSADHILPVLFGGETTLENLQTLCRPCNASKWCYVPQELAESIGIVYHGRNRSVTLGPAKGQAATL